MTEDEVEDETVDEAVVQIGGGERHFLEDTMNEKKHYQLGVIFNPILVKNCYNFFKGTLIFTYSQLQTVFGDHGTVEGGLVPIKDGQIGSTTLDTGCIRCIRGPGSTYYFQTF